MAELTRPKLFESIKTVYLLILLYFIVLYCTVLYFIVMHCTLLYSIAFYLFTPWFNMCCVPCPRVALLHCHVHINSWG